MNNLAPFKGIERIIYFLRGQKVILDFDLAALYGVSVGRLNEAVKRNIKRFPQDFMFQLSGAEAKKLRFQFETSNLKSQIAISSYTWGGRRHFPYAFTEQGVAMLSSVLHSERAIGINILIMRAFVRLREIIASHKDLTVKVAELEKKYEGHDDQIRSIFDTMSELREPPVKPIRRIGFR